MPTQQPAMPQSPSQPVVGEVTAGDASNGAKISGSVVLTSSGTRVLSGSNLSAGAGTATLRLARGGAVRICPNTNLAISASASSRELMLGLSSGAIEVNYSLAANADAIQTADVRFTLTGPGAFHLIIGTDAHGSACVRSLPGNAAAVIASELMSDASYQVKPDESVVFTGGKLSQASHDLPVDCGCPPEAAPPATTLASATPPAPPAEKSSADTKAAAQSVPPAAAPVATPPETAPVPASKPGATHVEVDAPFVFHGDDPTPPPPTIVATVRLTDRAPMLSLAPFLVPPPQPPPPPEKEAKRGFFGKMRGFFASVFR